MFKEHQLGRALAGRWVGRLVSEAWGFWSPGRGRGECNGHFFFLFFFSTLALVLRLADNIQSTQLNLNFKQATNHF